LLPSLVGFWLSSGKQNSPLSPELSVAAGQTAMSQAAAPRVRPA